MIEEAEARARILAAVPAPVSELIPLEIALGRYAGEEVVAGVAIPGFDNSAMDGYAVRAADATTGAELKVTGEQAAGSSLGLVLGAGEAIRIFTGAPMPEGADAVVMQEDTERGGDVVRITDAAAGPGEFVRRRGSDLCEGQRILTAGDRLSPQRIGLLASQGISKAPVGQMPRIGVMSTGDELVAAGCDLGEGQIYDSNGIMLASMAQRLMPGALTVRRYHAGDEISPLRKVLTRALDENDVLVIAGGVSVGDRDLVKPTLEEVGVETGFWRVRLKPGKPFLFGSGNAGRKLVFGLPGNPVSAFVTFEVFVAPALRRWMGAREDEVMPRPIRVELAEAVENSGGRPHYLRGILDGSGRRFSPAGMQQSHALNGLARADALLRLEPGESVGAEGEVAVFPVA
ncbi:MAG: molybdopterin molybdotransferase MoeA [Verrucomicrobiales bacterium]